MDPGRTPAQLEIAAVPRILDAAREVEQNENLPVASILTVDDYRPSLYAHARLLRGAGFDVVEATTGRGALEIAQREQPDLVLLDVHLPDIHGFEVCERLKSHRLTKDIPVVHITATSRGDRFQRESIAAGAAAFLQEPVAPQDLLRLVEEVLERSRSRHSRRHPQASTRAAGGRKKTAKRAPKSSRPSRKTR